MLDGTRHRVASDHTRQVFSLFGCIGAAAYGAAFVKSKTIDGLIDEFTASTSLGDHPDIDKVAKALGVFFSKHLKEDAEERGVDLPGSGKWPLGFLVAGYDAAGIGHLREVRIPSAAPVATKVNTSAGGAVFRGQTEVIRRLLDGIDTKALGDVALPEDIRGSIANLAFQMNYPVTLQDAVDLVCFCIRLTVETQRFTDGTYQSPGSIPTCGGRTQVLAVSKGGTHWIQRPRVAVAGAHAALPDGA